MDDIGESNQRQSDFYWGYEDASDGRLPRSDSPAYLRGYEASRPGGAGSRPKA